MPVDRRRLRRHLPVSLLLAAACLALGSPGASPLAAQTPPAADESGKDAPGAASGTTGEPRSFDDPFDAYEAEAWDEALAGFLDRQAKKPDDPEEALNVGSARYQKGEYEEAARTFRTVAGSASPDTSETVRQKAFYNLGNAAYRQGRMEEAVEHYRDALELDPDDEDAKINLELVQRELRRREQPSQQQPQQGEGEPQQDQQGQNQQSQGEQSQGGSQDERPQDPSQQSQEEESSGESGRPRPEGPDQDGDGLPDELERQAENPTDPNNPDTDGDGLQDGAEDLNANGRVDPQETDPNRRDTDGDGVPDGREPQQQSPGAAQPVPGEVREGLTEEEALRYLMALEESRPPHKPADARAAQAGRPSKDW